MLKSLFYSKEATALATWVALGTAFFAVLSWFTPEAVGQLSWPQAVLAGIFLTLVTSLLLAVILAIFAWGFRRLRPLPLEKPPATPDDPFSVGLDRAEQRSESGALETRLTGALDGLKESIQAKDETVGSNFGALQDRVVKLEAQVSLDCDNVAQRFSSVYLALSAIYHRERLLALAKGIDEKSLELAVPLAEGKTLAEEDWETWKREKMQWEATVAHWSQYAAVYLGRDPMNEIKRINSEGLDEDWGAKAHQFPDPEGLRVYKTFRIYVRNWSSIRDVVHTKVRQIAFEGVVF